MIFTPAWHGYNYEVTHDIHVQLSRGSDNELIDTFTLPIDLDIRHAAINRTWTEISYLEVSLIAFVSGIVFIDYDDKVTPLLADKTSLPLGTLVSQEIISRINKYDGLGGAAKLSERKAIGPGKTVTERLAELKALKDSGGLTEEEYKTKRDALIKDL